MLVFACTQPVLAHGDEPRIEISPESLSPGAVLDIRGIDFELDKEITLSLAGSQNEVPLGTAIADVEGVFLLTVTLPVDLAEGTYVIRATTDDHVLDSPPIIVWGSANLGGGEDGSRSEEDGLLAPIPTFAPDFVPDSALSQPISQVSQSVPQPTVKPSQVALTVILIMTGIGFLATLRLRMARKAK